MWTNLIQTDDKYTSMFRRTSRLYQTFAECQRTLSIHTIANSQFVSIHWCSLFGLDEPYSIILSIFKISLINVYLWMLNLTFFRVVWGWFYIIYYNSTTTLPNFSFQLLFYFISEKIRSVETIQGVGGLKYF